MSTHTHRPPPTADPPTRRTQPEILARLGRRFHEHQDLSKNLPVTLAERSDAAPAVRRK